MFATDYRAAGRRALKGRWATAIVTTFVGALLGAHTLGLANLTTSATGAAGGNALEDRATQLVEGGAQAASWWQQTEANLLRLMYEFVYEYRMILAAFASALFIYSIVVLVFGGAVDLGLKNYYIRSLQNDRKAGFGTLFSRFGIFGRAFLLQLLISVFVALWSLLFVIPGIIAAYRYAMAPYILAQNPGMGVIQALGRSKQMMSGRKWRLFCLHASYIGWFFVGALTLGVGFLWVGPYLCAGQAAFYMDASGQLPPLPQEGDVPYMPDEGQVSAEAPVVE